MLGFLKGHPQVDIATYDSRIYYKRVKDGFTERMAIHQHAPDHIRTILADPIFTVKNPIVTVRDPVSSMISRCARNKNHNAAARPVLDGALSIMNTNQAFYFPIDLNLNKLDLLAGLCNHVDLEINDYVKNFAKEWKPINSEVNELHIKLTNIYENEGFNALVKEMPVPFLELKLHCYLMKPFLTNLGYQLNW